MTDLESLCTPKSRFVTAQKLVAADRPSVSQDRDDFEVSFNKLKPEANVSETPREIHFLAIAPDYPIRKQ